MVAKWTPLAIAAAEPLATVYERIPKTTGSSARSSNARGQRAGKMVGSLALKGARA